MIEKAFHQINLTMNPYKSFKNNNLKFDCIRLSDNLQKQSH